MLFKKSLNESNRKPNKIWVDKGSEFCYRSMKSFLQNNDIEIYSTHNEGKCVKKTDKHMTSLSKICVYWYIR